MELKWTWIIESTCKNVVIWWTLNNDPGGSKIILKIASTNIENGNYEIEMNYI